MPKEEEEKEKKGRHTTQEYDIRQSLLEHYSSQTVAHATYLLTLALIGAALVGLPLQTIWLTIGLSVVTALMFRTSFRTVYWGTLAHAIIRVDRELGVSPAQKTERDTLEGLQDPSLETLTLHNAAAEYAKRKRSKVARYFASLDKRVALFTVGLPFVLSFAVLWLCAPWLFK